MKPFNIPKIPTMIDLDKCGRSFPPNFLHESWMDFLYWDVQLEKVTIFFSARKIAALVVLFTIVRRIL